MFLGLGTELEQIVASNPDALVPKILLTRFYRGSHQVEKAIPIMKDALRRDPFNPRIHYEMGTLYQTLNLVDAARASLQESLQIEPSQPNAYVKLGRLSLRDGDGLSMHALTVRLARALSPAGQRVA